MVVVWLGSAAGHEAARVGAKAANLSRLAATYRVPPGFAVPDLLSTTRALPAEVAGAVNEAYRSLAERTGEAEPRVAVRSSGIDEDGAGSSFAGQHATFLNITGEEALLDAILRCCASAGSSTAQAYRAARGAGARVEDVPIAVLVQHLVEADVAAVAFSANPVTGARDEVVINASWGLGESVVSGLVTPDMFIVRPGTPPEIERSIAEKRVMTVMAEGGTHEVPVDEERRTAACLDDSQVAAMAELARALEAEMGWPADIECAIAGGDLYLLQCRPITTLGG